MKFITRNFSEHDKKYFRKSVAEYAKVGIKMSQGDPPDVIVYLTSKNAMKKLYPTVAKSGLSVTDRGKSPYEIHLNEDNWNSIPTHLGSEFTDLEDYRVALISHEFSHVLGHDHVKCACVGCDMDVRQQPSRKLYGCTPTTKVVFNKKSPHTNINL